MEEIEGGGKRGNTICGVMWGGGLGKIERGSGKGNTINGVIGEGGGVEGILGDQRK